MPISYRIHADLGLVVTRYVGVVTSEQLIEMFQSVMDDPEHQPGFKVLADAQEIKDFKATAGAMRRASGIIGHAYAGRSEIMRTAIIAPPDLIYGMARMLQRIC